MWIDEWWQKECHMLSIEYTASFSIRSVVKRVAWKKKYSEIKQDVNKNEEEIVSTHLYSKNIIQPFGNYQQWYTNDQKQFLNGDVKINFSSIFGRY